MSLIMEAARLMGAGTTDPASLEALRRAVELAERLAFHSLVRDISISFEEDSVLLDGAKAPGRDLSRHLCGCREGVLIGVTLGMEGDRLLRTESLRGLTQAAAMQAALSARLEAGLDELCASLNAGQSGQVLTSRFSPGYGDLPLAFQPFMMDHLHMSHLGVHLTGSLMMVPVKSVTAIAGWKSGKDASPSRHKCSLCNQTNCPFRQREE